VDVITCDKFFGNLLRGIDSVVVENGGFPLTKPSAVNTADTTVQRVMYRYFHFVDEYNVLHNDLWCFMHISTQLECNTAETTP